MKSPALKSLLALLLCFTLFVGIVGCGGKEEPPPASSSDSTVVPSDTDDKASGTSEEVSPYPASSTLQGTVHIPPIGNQGSIGCCTSMAITYMQFTIAVSQYLHSIDPDTEWNPSSGNEAYIFSPKFTYNYSGAGTAYAYNVLMDHGALTVKDTFFEVSSGGAPILKDNSGGYAYKTASWSVNEGEMEQALNYRLIHFEEQENTSMQLTKDKETMNKIKDAICRGNGVVFSCWSSNWRQTDVDRTGLGNLGKRGDRAIYTSIDNTAFTGSKEDASGNHSVCIVGYDDDITCTVAGVTLKGAFQIANSWGSGWGNNGFIWMMYDAFNTTSEYPILNDGEYYSSTKHVTPAVNDFRLRTVANADDPAAQQLLFTKLKDGETEQTISVEGKTYSLYSISTKDGQYLGMKDGKVQLSAGPVTGGAKAPEAFALIPYSDAAEWPGVTRGNYDESYKGSFLLYAAASEAGSSGKGLLAGNKENRLEAAGFEKGKNQKNCCFTLSEYNRTADSFTCRASLTSSAGKTGIRTASGYRFSFIYWDEDLRVGKPGAMVEVVLSAAKRDNLKMTLGRADASGNLMVEVPALFEYNIAGTSQLYTKNMTFSGRTNDDGALEETAYFTVGYNELAQLTEGYSNDNFLWTVTVSGTSVSVKQITLKEADGTILLQAKIPESYPTLQKGESYSFLMNAGGELRTYSAAAEGRRRIVNVADDKYLTRNKMRLAMNEKATKDGIFEVKYDEEKGGYFLYVYGDSYLLDISGKEIKEDVVVKLNAYSVARQTQIFEMQLQEDGSYRIALHADPSYVICNDAENGLCLKKAETAGERGKWRFLPIADDEGIAINGEKKDGKVILTAGAPERITEGELTVTVTDAEGKTVHTEKVTIENGGYSMTMDAPEAGCYLFTTSQDGKIVGTQLLFQIR